MRLVYKDRWGRRHVREFSTLHDLITYIVDNYPFFQVAGALGLVRLLK